jgi:Carboxypeptidase regulatory-like domain
MKFATYVALVSLLLAVPFAQAQLSRGSLTGVVTDSTGAVIPNAKVTVVNPNTAASWQTVTNANGQYSVPNLPPGPYELTFESASFKKLVRSGIDLGATEVLRVDAALEIGAVTESVQITAESPRLQTETPEVGTSLINTEIQNS